ncbi:MAG TPA: hypothetical protein VEJ47_19975 [Candidatus Eremiobacteraceae bacterium]|nr:hypothetical protein [Candidatus Eremiobacteraceae bacterium]
MPFQNKKRILRSRSYLSSLISKNTRLARKSWGITMEQGNALKALTDQFQLSVALGDLILLDGNWYVTHAGLLRLAERRHCAGIRVQQMCQFCDPAAGRWVFKATLYKRRRSQGFVGFGDADPSNVSSLVRGAEMRVAETRAVNRALRKAYGIGLCSVEELGAFPNARPSPASPLPTNGSHPSSGNGQPRLRDQLCLLIRQYNLDANLVKAYAADFCGTETLRGASRELVESFITHLSAAAKENRDALVCKPNSYSQQVEARS